MLIKRKLSFNKEVYYIYFKVEYVKSDINQPKLILKDNLNNNFDCGDITILLKKIETSYIIEDIDKTIGFMNNILNIYKCIPILFAIEEVTNPNDICYITKDEIEEYIKNFKIDFNYNLEFCLSNELTWNI